MQIKKEKISKKNLIIVIILLLPIILSLKNINIRNSKENIIQYIMSYDLGFSGRKNLVDRGEGIFANGMSEGFFLYNQKIIKEVFKSFPSIILYKIFNQSNFDNLYINVNFNNLEIIDRNKKKALEVGLLNNPDFVNAEIVYKGINYESKIRLKGDYLGHIKTNRRNSFRVHLANDKTIMGISKFSIQKPSERQFPYNHTYQKMIRDMGNIAPKDKYVNVIFNGVNWGIMNIEEHISSELLEKQKRKNSLVLRFGNEKNWKKNNAHPLYLISDPSINYNVYNDKQTFKNINNRRILTYIYRDKNPNNSNLFDYESFSNALISSSIWGNYHSLLNNNTRFYFNPYILKLELITTDQEGFKLISNLNDFSHSHLPINFKNLLRDRDFQIYLKNKLNKIKKSKINIQEYFNDINLIFPIDKIKKTNFFDKNLLFIDNNFDKIIDFLSQNKNDIKDNSTLKNADIINFDEYLSFRHYDDGQIEIFNFIPKKIKIKDIIFNNKSYLDKEIEIPAYKELKNPFKIKTDIFGFQDYKIKVIAEFEGVKKEAKNKQTFLSEKIENPLIFDDNQYNKDYIIKNKDSNYIFKPGNHKIFSPIKINGELTIPKGVSLQFSKNAYLLINGSIKIDGKKDYPVTIGPIAEKWKGIYVYNSYKKSSIKHTIINNTNYTTDGILDLTGGINFYNTQLSIQNLKINNSFAEDAINIVNSNFLIENLIISNSKSDGIDLDFSNGAISKSFFNKIGGDAIDFSGSNVNVYDVDINYVVDKGISVGEDSNILINESIIKNTNVGLVSKDGSKTVLKNSKILNYGTFSAMSYIKKNFYSKPTLLIENSIVGNEENLLRQIDTIMKIDNNYVSEKKFNVKKFYN